MTTLRPVMMAKASVQKFPFLLSLYWGIPAKLGSECHLVFRVFLQEPIMQLKLNISINLKNLDDTAHLKRLTATCGGHDDAKKDPHVHVECSFEDKFLKLELSSE